MIYVCLVEEIVLEVLTKLRFSMGKHVVKQAVAVSQHDDVANNGSEATGVRVEFFVAFDFESDWLTEIVNAQNHFRNFTKNNHFNNL